MTSHDHALAVSVFALFIYGQHLSGPPRSDAMTHADFLPVIAMTCENSFSAVDEFALESICQIEKNLLEKAATTGMP